MEFKLDILSNSFFIGIMEQLLNNSTLLKLLSINRKMIYARKYIRKLICHNSNNSNKSVVTFIESFENLRLLSLQNVKNVDYIRKLKFPKHLHNLNLSNNNLSSDDLKNIEFPAKLRVLTLNNNWIENLNFKIPQKIKWLNISYNIIKSIDSIFFPKSLKMISLSSNLLTNDSFDDFYGSKRLKFIDISENKISKLKIIFLCNKFKIIAKYYTMKYYTQSNTLY